VTYGARNSPAAINSRQKLSKPALKDKGQGEMCPYIYSLIELSKLAYITM